MGTWQIIHIRKFGGTESFRFQTGEIGRGREGGREGERKIERERGREGGREGGRKGRREGGEREREENGRW